MVNTTVQPELYEIGSAGATQLIQSFEAEPPVAFVGSGISIWEPSAMPTGQDFTASLFSLLFDQRFEMEAKELPIIKQLFNEMPFEHILEVCPKPEAAAALILDLYGKETPNLLHEALARSLRQGKISSLVTTNYDCCIETALNQTTGGPVEKVVIENDCSAVNSWSTLYFKIHGSSEAGLEHTAIRTLAEECLLPRWKRGLLERLLRRKTVVFVGYSGRDFELCPEIARISPRKIVWVTRAPSPPSVNARALLQKTTSHILHGDLNAILGEWLGSAPATLTTGMTAATKQAIENRFTTDQFREWRLAILIRIGAPVLALRTLDSAPHIDPIVSQRQRGHIQVSAGRYRHAARYFLQASIKQYRSCGGESAADALLDTCDAYRIYGAVARSWVSFAGAVLLAGPKSRAKMFLKLGLLIFTAQGFLSLRLLTPLRRWLRRRSVMVLKKCATKGLATGNWLDFQQAGLLAKRMQIPLTDLAEGDFYPPPDPSEGYLQLGYFVAQSMAVLDELEARPPDSRSSSERAELTSILSRQLHFCDVLGIAPQSWKLRAAGRKCFDLDTQAEAQYLSTMIKDYRACEFSFLMRWYWRRRFPFLNAALRNNSN